MSDQRFRFYERFCLNYFKVLFLRSYGDTEEYKERSQPEQPNLTSEI